MGMVNHNATEGTMTKTTTTHLTKVGNAYATTDLRFRVTKNASHRWTMCDTKTGQTHELGTVGAWAFTTAESIITRTLDEEALPWDRTAPLPTTMWGEKYHASGADSSDWSDYQPCQCCGRKVGKNPLYAIVVGGGARLCALDDAGAFEKHDGGWMGCYPIGRECAKQFPAGYLTVLPQIN